MSDAIVVGAGPAGSTAALTMARRGLDVLLLDAQPFPRRKICGGAVAARAFSLLDEEFYAAFSKNAVRGVIFAYGGDLPVRYDREEPYAYIVDRAEFDQYLVERAQRVGVRFRDAAEVTAVRTEAHLVRVIAGGEEFRARFVVAADGVRGRTARLAGIGGPPDLALTLEADVPDDLGVRARLDGALLIDYGAVRSGYGWIFPRGDGLSVGIGTFGALSGSALRSAFRRFVAAYLPGLDPASVAVRGYLVPRGGRRRGPLCRGRVLVAGDAAGLADPFFGEGIHWAMLSGKLAGEAVAAALGGEPLERYAERVDHEIGRELRIARYTSLLFYRMPGFFHRHLVSKKEIIGQFLDMVAGHQGYRAMVLWLMANLVRQVLARPAPAGAEGGVFKS